MRIAVVVTVLAGCGFQVGASQVGTDDASTTSDGDRTGDGAAGDGPLPTVDAAIDAPPTNPDLDNDGVMNAMDNCPTVANTTQWNEDMDLLGDLCDPCPQYAAVQLDTDSDSIGNDCDPRPTMAGDTLALFEGFNVNGAVPAGWTTSGGGTWGVLNGALGFTPGANSPGFALHAVTAGDHTVDAQVIAGAVVGQTPQVVATVIDATTTLDRFFMCSISSYETLFRFARWNSAWSEISSTSATPVPPNTYTVVARALATSQSCRLGGAAMMGGVPRNNGTRVGFRSVNVISTFPYIAVYRSP